MLALREVCVEALVITFRPTTNNTQINNQSVNYAQKASRLLDLSVCQVMSRCEGFVSIDRSR